MTTNPQHSKGRSRELLEPVWAYIGSWDTYASGTLGLIVFLWSGIAPIFSPGSAGLAAAASASVFLAGAAHHMGITLTQETRSHFFGQLIRVFDPPQKSLRLPYQIIAYVGIAAIVWNLAGVVVIGDLSGWYAALVYGVSTWLTSWALLGVVSLMRLSARHESRRAEAQALKEQFQRAQKAARSP